MVNSRVVPSCAAIVSDTAIVTGLKKFTTNNGKFHILYRNYDGKKQYHIIYKWKIS